MAAKKRAKRRSFGRVRKLPSGRYQVRYPGPDGVLRPADRTFATTTDADLWLAKRRVEIEEGRWLDPDLGKVTVGEWSDRWLESARPGLKASTHALYEGLIRSRIKPRLGTVEVAALQPIMVAEWVADMRLVGLSPARIRHAYIVLNQVMAAAVNNGLRAFTPCRGIKMPRIGATEPRILTPAQVERLLGELTGRDRVLVLLLAYAGLRLGEGFALHRSSIAVDGSRIVVSAGLTEVNGKQVLDTPKSHQKREITIPPSVASELRAWVQNLPTDVDPYAFTGANGKPLHYNWWRARIFDPAAIRAGLVGVTPKDLRATHATWIADRLGVMAAAKRLGHSNASVTTRHYARAVEARQQETAQVLDDMRDAAKDTPPRRARKGHGKQSGRKPPT